LPDDIAGVDRQVLSPAILVPTSKAKRSRSKRLPYVIRYYLQTVAVLIATAMDCVQRLLAATTKHHSYTHELLVSLLVGFPVSAQIKLSGTFSDS